MADPTTLRRPPRGSRYDPNALDAKGRAVGDILAVVDDGSGGKRSAWASADDVTGGASSGRPANLLLPFVVDTGRRTVLGKHGPALEDLESGFIRVNLAAGQEIRGQATVTHAGALTGFLDVKYSTDDGDTWPDDQVLGVRVPLKNAKHAVGFAATVPAGAAGDVLLKGVCGGGNGIAVPKIRNFLVKSTSSEQPPEDGEDEPITPSDYPSGGSLGNIILLVDALKMLNDGIAAGALASVNDYSSGNHDGAPHGAYGQTAPTFVPNGFDGTRPSIRLNGVDNGLRFPAPTIDKFTCYFALANVTGEGTGSTGGSGTPNAPILMGQGQNPRASMRGDGKITVAVNPSIFDLNQQMSAAAWDGSTPRRHKMIWDRVAGDFFWSVNGTTVISYVSADTGLFVGLTHLVIGILTSINTNGLAADVGLVLMYDTPHTGSIGATVDTAIDATWGTGP